MGKWGQSTRWLKLMSFVRYENIGEWEHLDEKTQEHYVPKFMDWFYDHLPFIPDETIQTAMVEYYEKAISRDPKTGYHQKLERGRIALASLYNQEKERVEYYGERVREGAGAAD
jgi:hypothetical protein